MSPRTLEGATPFGSTSSRPHLWLGENAAAGPTSNHVKEPPRGPSPRVSMRGSVAGASSRVCDDGEGEDSPGPGAYNVKSSFSKPGELRKNPSKGASSAFKSTTKRLLGKDGEVLDDELYPGHSHTVGPGVGTYTPSNSNSIASAAAAIARRAEKLQKLRQSFSKPKERFTTISTSIHGPGPGAYEPNQAEDRKKKRL